MRLLETRTTEPGNYPLALKYVLSPEDVEYAILSHTWADDELSYEDVVHQRGATKQGFLKVCGALRQARHDKYDYLWVDSVCIDKSSSTELQEALNSMHTWYQKSMLCYAYLADVPPTGGENTRAQSPSFANSRWFSRGWTLQELIAPKNLIFLAADWSFIGDKATLLGQLCDLTGISAGILSDADAIDRASVAARMSWAAKRQTTRPEDRAYALMGIFGVHMSMSYGEGAAGAFMRLQVEIMSQSNDYSIFAWRDEKSSEQQLHGLLADSPDVFGFEDANLIRSYERSRPRGPYTMTNQGLQITLTLIPLADQPERVFLASINCTSPQRMGTLEVYLLRLYPNENIFARICCNQLPVTSPAAPRWAKRELIYVPQNAYSADRSEMTTAPMPKEARGGVFPSHAFGDSLDNRGLGYLRLTGSFIDHTTNYKPVYKRDLEEDQLEWLQTMFGRTRSHTQTSIFPVTLRERDMPCLSVALKAYHSGRAIEIGLGRRSNGKIGFDMVTYQRGHNDACPRWKMFDFRPLGTIIRFTDHDVTITAELSIRHGVVFHDMSIQVLPLHMSSASASCSQYGALGLDLSEGKSMSASYELPGEIHRVPDDDTGPEQMAHTGPGYRWLAPGYIKTMPHGFAGLEVAMD